MWIAARKCVAQYLKHRNDIRQAQDWYKSKIWRSYPLSVIKHSKQAATNPLIDVDEAANEIVLFWMTKEHGLCNDCNDDALGG